MPRSVMRPGSPGPAPTKYTMPLGTDFPLVDFFEDCLAAVGQKLVGEPDPELLAFNDRAGYLPAYGAAAINGRNKADQS